MADITEVQAGGIREIRQVDAESFTIVTTDDKVCRIALPPGQTGPEGSRGETGPTGPRGEIGSSGADGADGRDGLDGNDGSDGRGVSFAQVLRDGTLAIMLDDETVINAGKVVGEQGPRGEVGQPGVRGQAGADGAAILLFPGSPDPAAGKTGDLAINTSEMLLYQKQGMSWGTGTPMVNPVNLDQQIRAIRNGGNKGMWGMGAPSIGIAANTGTGLDPILSNGLPLAANTAQAVLTTGGGDEAVHVLIKADAPTGSYYCEVVATTWNGQADHVVAWEISQGATPPNLTFTAGDNAGEITLDVTSDIALDEIRGKLILI